MTEDFYPKILFCTAKLHLEAPGSKYKLVLATLGLFIITITISDQTVPSLGSSLNTSPKSDDSLERYSRKVFVGGLPPDIDEGKFREN